MSTITEVIDALAATITAATGWSCTQNWDNPNPPCVLLYPDSLGDGGTYYQAMARGVVTIPIVANVLVSSTNSVGQARNLYDAVSPFGASSIPQAIYQNPTLGTNADEQNGAGTMSAVVVRVDDIGPVFDETTRMLRYIGAKVRIDVQTRGDR